MGDVLRLPVVVWWDLTGGWKPCMLCRVLCRVLCRGSPVLCCVVQAAVEGTLHACPWWWWKLCCMCMTGVFVDIAHLLELPPCQPWPPSQAGSCPWHAPCLAPDATEAMLDNMLGHGSPACGNLHGSSRYNLYCFISGRGFSVHL